MKFLIVGGGSMGKRRIRCLLANQVTPDRIRIVDVREDRREESKTKYGVEGFSALAPGLDWNPDVVFVSVPGALHVPVCLEVARAGKHLFCEVPLSLNLEGVDELAATVARKGLLLAPGCQPPFHPLYRQLKAWIAEPGFGRTLAVVEVFGQYLPDWHPYEDYRTFYAASQKLGGCNLDVIAQQATVLGWLLEDQVAEVYCRGRHLSQLEIDGSDCYQVIATTRKGTALTQQYDLIQRAGYHSLRLISEAGTLEYTPGAGNVRRYLAATKAWDTVAKPDGFQYEQCYVDETALFLECVAGRNRWHVAFESAVAVVRLLMAMQSSAHHDRSVRVEP